MALQKQTKQFAFGSGVDTRSDQDITPIGKLHMLENGMFSKTGSITKVPGVSNLSKSISGGGYINQISALLNYNDQLYCAQSFETGTVDKIYGFSIGGQIWNEICPTNIAQGRTLDVPLYKKNVNYDGSGKTGTTCHSNIVVNNYIISQFSSTDWGYCNRSFIDINTNEVVLSEDFGAGAGVALHRQIQYNNYYYSFNWVVGTGITFTYTNFTGGLSALGAGSVLYADISAVAANRLFDVIYYPNTSQFFIAYNNNAGGISCKSFTINTGTGAVTTVNTNVIAEVAAKGLSIGSAKNNIYAAWGKAGTGTRIRCYDTALTAVYTNTLSAGEPTAVGVANYYDSADSTTYVTYEYLDTTIPYYIENISFYTVNNVGTVSLNGLNGVFLHSKPFVYNGLIYLVVLYSSSEKERSYYLMNINAGKMIPVCKLISGNAGAPISTSSPSSGGIQPITIGVSGHNNIWVMPGTEFIAPYDKTSDKFGPVILIFDLAPTAPLQQVQMNDLAYFTGGYLGQFDGNIFVESNFFEYPDKCGLVDSAAAGPLVAAGTYQFCHLWEWYDSKGVRHQSAPSTPTTITLGVGHTNCDIYCEDIFATLKGTTNLVIYRTENNGTLFYRDNPTYVGSTRNVKQYNPGLSDTDLIAQEILYTTGGILENICPASVTAVCNWKNRLITLGDDGILYSKEVSAGYAAGMNFLLNININGIKGKPTGIAALQDKLIIFYKDSVHYIVGDGPNDSGQGGNFSLPQLLLKGVGAIRQSGIIEAQDAVYFHSYDGWRVLDKSLTCDYFGTEMDYFMNSSSVIYSAIYMDKIHQLRITDSTKTYIYDTFYKQWSVLTNRAALDLINIGEACYWLTYNQVGYDDYSSYKFQNSFYSLRIRTGWIRLDQLIGFQRAWRLFILARYKNTDAHTLKLRVYHDYVPAVNETHTIDTSSVDPCIWDDSAVFGNSSTVEGNNPYIVEAHLKIQKCNAIRFEISDINQSGIGQDLDLVGITLEFGVKPQGAKIRDAASM